MDQQSYSLPSLSVPKFRWWHCISCIKDIDADGTKGIGPVDESHFHYCSYVSLDIYTFLLELMHVSLFPDCGLHSNSRTIGNSSVIPSTNKLNSLAIIDHEKERKTNIAGMHLHLLV